MNDPTGRSQLEEVLGDPDTVLATQRRRFWEFHNRINSSSAPTASYLEACEALSLDPGDPVLKATSRVQTKPEHNASNDASQPLCDIPRCLIELTPKQWSDLGPEPPRISSKVEGTEQSHQLIDVSRQRFLASRSAIEAEPAAWL